MPHRDRADTLHGFGERERRGPRGSPEEDAAPVLIVYAGPENCDIHQASTSRDRLANFWRRMVWNRQGVWRRIKLPARRPTRSITARVPMSSFAGGSLVYIKRRRTARLKMIE